MKSVLLQPDKECLKICIYNNMCFGWDTLYVKTWNVS